MCVRASDLQTVGDVFPELLPTYGVISAVLLDALIESSELQFLAAENGITSTLFPIRGELKGDVRLPPAVFGIVNWVSVVELMDSLNACWESEVV